MPTYFVPMTGQSDRERTVKPDPTDPQIRNGSFEDREENGSLAGWYNQRQVTLMSREAADDLELEAGVQAIAVVKATNVIIER